MASLYFRGCMRTFFCLLALGLCTAWGLAAHGQPTDTTERRKPVLNHWQHELMAITENDNYTLLIRDGYYTNGLMLSFSTVGKSRQQGYKTAPKLVHTWEVGQQIFNPVRYDSAELSGQDRPFTGYLYARYQQRRSYPRSLWQWSLSLGLTGRGSGAEAVQQWYHSAIGIYAVPGWSTQLNTEFSVNASATYAATWLPGPVVSRRTDLSGWAQANVGNALTDGTVGLLLRLGRMENLWNSVHWANRISRPHGPAPEEALESYVFFEPSLTWQAYNASLQGGLFLDDKGPKTVPLQPWVWATRLGYALGQNRFSLKVYWTHRSAQARQQIRHENFVSFHLAYRIGRYLPQL